MMPHLSNLRTSVREAVDEATAEYWTSANVDNAINRAAGDIWNEIVTKGYHLRVLTTTFATVANTELYDLPLRHLVPVRIARLDSAGALQYEILPLHGVHSQYGVSGGGILLSDRSHKYYLQGLEIGIRPPPSDAFTVQIKYQPYHSDLVASTAAAATSTTITLASDAVAEADYYDELLITITGGTGSGQTRRISGYTAARVATVSTAWTTTPDTTSTYALHTSIPESGYNWLVYTATQHLDVKDRQVRPELRALAYESRRTTLPPLHRGRKPYIIPTDSRFDH